MAALGIIAGGGDLPRAIAENARENGRQVFVAVVDDAVGPWVAAFPHDRSSMGLVSKTLGLLHAHNCKDVVFAGYVSRPNFFKLRYDWKGITWFPPVLWGMRSGDNTLLDVMAGLFEKEGFSMKGVGDVAPGLQIAEGPLGRVAPTADDERDIATAISLARAHGKRDEGQAIVVRAAKVLAIDGRDGTDAMLQRLGTLPPGRGVLAKALKPMQTRKSDLPTIGVATVRNAAACGLAGIAIEAHTAVVLGKAAVIEAADARGLFVVGVPARA